MNRYTFRPEEEAEFDMVMAQARADAWTFGICYRSGARPSANAAGAPYRFHCQDFGKHCRSSGENMPVSAPDIFGRERFKF